MPSGQIKSVEIAFIIEGRKPVHSIHWTDREPGLKAIVESICVWRILYAKNFHTQRVQLPP
jgi:hypothetical protein